MNGHAELLLNVLARPDCALELSLWEWSLLIRLARKANVLALIATRLKAAGLLMRVPEAPLAHLEAALRLAGKQQRVVRFEIDRIRDVLVKLDMPLVLLKGAAYLHAGLPLAQGRLFSDIDILVPKNRLNETEKFLMLHGWLSGEHDAYDQHYYRTWMHELPPLTHASRRTVMDVHHNILPETARLKPDAQKLLADVVSASEDETVVVLAPVDMVLHSATHLFHEGELENGLRDLADLDGLLRHFSEDEKFWDRLVERAVDMDLCRPLYYALHYSRQMFQTPVPDLAMKAAASIGKPSKPLARWMDELFGRALMPDHPLCDDAFTPLARWALYVRSHYLRMPLHLLIPHLLRKAIKSRFESSKSDELKLENI